MKSKYLTRISWAARWMLPPGEAQEVIADYKEIISERKCSDRELYSEFGTPYSAILLLSDRKELRRWTAVFAVLAAFLLLAVCRAQILRQFWIMGAGWQELRGVILLLALAISLWFCRDSFSNSDRPVSPWLLLSCILLALSAFGIILWFWHVYGLTMAGNPFPWNFGSHLDLNIRILNWLSGIFALLALVMARSYDRRWLGLYITALTVLAIGATIIWVLKSLNLTDPIGAEMRSMFHMVAILAGIGLAGTGVALLC